jgi:hypothetical protein
MPLETITKYALAEWRAEGERRFGPDYNLWKFVCPSCGNVASVGDFREHAKTGASPNSATEVCIGRYTGASGAFDPAKHRPCNYAGFGLFRLSPVRVIHEDGHESHCFAFAEAVQNAG